MRILSLLLLFIVLLPVPGDAREKISISLPEQVLAEAITATLPLSYAAHSKTLQGRLDIISISDLKLLDQKISGRLHLAGRELKVVTELAGHTINFNVGEVELDFHTIARLRFDAARQILYLTPMVDKVHTSKDGGGGDIGVAIIGLFDDRELPIRLDKLDPLLTHAGNKTLSITTTIADIRSRPEQLDITLVPHITARTK